jgi:hypothetical protein
VRCVPVSATLIARGLFHAWFRCSLTVLCDTLILAKRVVKLCKQATANLLNSVDTILYVKTPIEKIRNFSRG